MTGKLCDFGLLKNIDRGINFGLKQCKWIAQLIYPMFELFNNNKKNA